MARHSKNAVGTVYLVGAGPGNPGLITLRGVECLRRAELILYDYLVNPVILRHAPDDAEQICLGRHGHKKIWSQPEINDRMIQVAKQGKTVVRLKGGDPVVFARCAEEVASLRQHGIPYELVPGITTAIAAGSYADIPITHREFASAVALVTGQEAPSKLDESLDYASLASFPGTLVFYMGVTTAPTWTSSLIKAGKCEETPAIIVRRCTLPDQQTIPCTLGSIVHNLNSPTRIRPPAIIIVGSAASRVARTIDSTGPELQPSDEIGSEASEPNWKGWFEQLPLFGQTVMVTRPNHQVAALADPLEELGAQVVSEPAISIDGPPDWKPVDDALSKLDIFDWVVFLSANGVQAFLGRLIAQDLDARAFGMAKLATIGPATSNELRRYHLRPDRQPARFHSEDLADALTEDAVGKRFLLVRASRGRELLAEKLAAAGALVTQVVAYSSNDVIQPSTESLELLSAGRIAWTTVTSSAIARSLVRMFADQLRKTRLASISPITTETLTALGYPPAVEAREATMLGIVDAIRDALPK